MKKLTLIVKTGNEAGQEFALTRNRTSIGRDPANDVILSDGRVSGRHAVVERQDGDYIITDLGSKNGIFVNEKRIDVSYPLRPGDELRVGNTVFSVQAAPARGQGISPLVFLLAGGAVLIIIAAVLLALP